MHATAVGALDREPSERAAANGPGQRSRGRSEHIRVVGPGQQRLAAAFHVQHERTAGQDDQRARLAPRTVADRPVHEQSTGTFRPAERRSVGLSGVSGGKHHRLF